MLHKNWVFFENQ